MTALTALVAGEALIDEFPDRRVVAGAPLHVAVRLALLGWSVSAVTRVGDDADGRAITGTLDRYGVSTTLVEVDPDLPTGRTVIELEGSDHTFEVLPGAWDALGGPEPMPAADVLYFGTLALRDIRSRRAVARMVAATDATVVVDLNLRAPDYDDDRIREAVGHADVLKLNDEELTIACAACGVPEAADALHRFGPEWVVVTRGADGAVLSRAGGGRWEAAAPHVEVVDTVGAGDAFCATLIDGLNRREDPARVLRAAAAQGAATAAQRGGLPPEPGDDR